MLAHRPLAFALASVFLLVLPAAASKPPEAAQKDSRRPSLSVRASPTVAFSPARIVFTAELRGGADDYQDFYCGGVEWDWGDGTRSESTADCEPYEAGVSEIKRRFTMDHVFHSPGKFRVQFRLKRNGKSIVSASATVQVQPGVRHFTHGY
jgi:hypothetical protein